MEPERMRRVLGKAMGWLIDHKPWPEGHFKGYLVKGYYDDGTFVMPVQSWEPDKNSEQMMRVVDMMRAKRRDCSIWIDARGWSSVTWQSWNGETLGAAKCDTLPEAVSLAAARALESEVADE